MFTSSLYQCISDPTNSQSRTNNITMYDGRRRMNWTRKSNNKTGMKHNNCEVRAQCKVIKTVDYAVGYFAVNVMYGHTYKRALALQASHGLCTLSCHCCCVLDVVHSALELNYPKSNWLHNYLLLHIVFLLYFHFHSIKLIHCLLFNYYH